MQAIPKSMLIHQAVYHKKVSGSSFYEEDALDEGIPLKRVRMEPSAKIIRDKNNTEIQLAATLFYDCRNSRPRGIAFKVDDVVVFHGVRHRVASTEALYDDKKLHHYELGMVRYG